MQAATPQTKYSSVDELIGRVEGIERTILIDKDNDTLLSIVEKMALIPDSKLVLVEPVYIPCPESGTLDDATGGNMQNKIAYTMRPKVKGVLSTPDVISKLLSNQTI